MKPPRVNPARSHRRRGRFAWLRGRGAGRLATACIVVAMAGMQTGCAAMKKRAEERKAAERARKKEPRLIGVVKLVNTDGGFVLIDSGTNPAPDNQGDMKCRAGAGGAETADLRVSEIRRHPFVIADIVKGAPNKGDLVFQYPVNPGAR